MEWAVSVKAECGEASAFKWRPTQAAMCSTVHATRKRARNCRHFGAKNDRLNRGIVSLPAHIPKSSSARTRGICSAFRAQPSAAWNRSRPRDTDPNHDIVTRYSDHNPRLSLSPRDGISKTVRFSPLETGYRKKRYPRVSARRPRPTASAFRVLTQGSARTCVEASVSVLVSRLDKETLPTARRRPPNRPFSARSLCASLSPRPSGYDPDCQVMTRVSLPHNPGRG
jgi:hypothetical protein